MATFRLFVVCVLLALVYSVSSVKIIGTFRNSDNQKTEVEVSEYINGDNWNNTKSVFLHQLVDGDFLPSITLTNFKSLDGLEIWNISLEQAPVLENISAYIITVTKNKIKYIPSAFSRARAKHLHLENNEIQSISDGAFHMDLLELHIRCNQLSYFSKDWFKDPSNIRVLDLTVNQIEYIPPHAFNQMTKLFVVKLSHNRIKRIGSEAFGPGITNLHLQFNVIEQLPFDMFEDRELSIYFLFLHHNHLSFLPKALFQKFKINQISLVDNPWQCQCLRDIERWIRELNITRIRYLPSRPGEPACVVPRNFENVCVSTVDKELLQTYASGQSPVSKHYSDCRPWDLELDIKYSSDLR